MKKLLLGVVGMGLMLSPAIGQQAVQPYWDCGTQSGGSGYKCPEGNNYPLPVGTLPGVVVTSQTGTNTTTLAAAAYSRQLIYVHVVYTASATVGNRYIWLNLIDAGNNVVGSWETSAAITAGQSGYHVEFMPGTYRETAFDANHTIQTPYPMGLTIPAGDTLKVFDGTGVSTGDSETVVFEYSKGAP